MARVGLVALVALVDFVFNLMDDWDLIDRIDRIDRVDLEPVEAVGHEVMGTGGVSAPDAERGKRHARAPPRPTINP